MDNSLLVVRGINHKYIVVGSKEVFYKLKQQYPNVCLVHLYALQGAIDNIDYDKLSEEVKLDLKQFSDSIKEK